MCAVDTNGASNFQKTGSGLLVESSTTDDWSGGIKSANGSNDSASSQARSARRDDVTVTPPYASATLDPSLVSARAPGAGLSATIHDTSRSVFSNKAVSSAYHRPSTASSGASQKLHTDTNPWSDPTSLADDRLGTSLVSANTLAGSYHGSFAGSHQSDEHASEPMMMQPSSVDAFRPVRQTAQNMSLSPEQQIALQLGQMNMNGPLDAALPLSRPQSRSPNTFSYPLSAQAAYTTRRTNAPDWSRMNAAQDSYTDHPTLSPHAMYGQPHAMYEQKYMPVEATFYPGAANHLTEVAAYEAFLDGRPGSSSSTLSQGVRRDSAQSRELQAYCGYHTTNADLQAQFRARQVQALRPLLADPRTSAYYNQVAVSRANYNMMSATPNSLCGSPMLPFGYPPESIARMDTMTAPVQSAILEEFKGDGTKPDKRFELHDIYGHVVEFSGDHFGSRFIQSKLETANSEEKEHIFREIEPNAIQLMTDVFGNYVIQKLFEHGNQSQKRMLAGRMTGHMRNLSLQMYGCRVVQKALEHILADQQSLLIHELEQHVLTCVKDQNGNHVVQKAIERCLPSTIDFILSAFTGQVLHLSIHSYGCRVIQRCLEHCQPDRKAAIMAELCSGMSSLVSDQFGNYVVQHVVVHGTVQDRASVLRIVKDGLSMYSKHKFASNVVEKCLQYADDAWRHEIVHMLIAGVRPEGDSMVLDMIKDSFGNYVIRES